MTTQDALFDVTMADRNLKAWEGNRADADDRFISDRSIAMRRDHTAGEEGRYLIDLLAETPADPNAGDPFPAGATRSLWEKYQPEAEAEVLGIVEVDARWLGPVAVISDGGRRRRFFSVPKLRILWEVTRFTALHHTTDPRVFAATRGEEVVGYVAPLSKDLRLVASARRSRPDLIPEAAGV